MDADLSEAAREPPDRYVVNLTGDSDLENHQLTNLSESVYPISLDAFQSIKQEPKDQRMPDALPPGNAEPGAEMTSLTSTHDKVLTSLDITDSMEEDNVALENSSPLARSVSSTAAHLTNTVNNSEDPDLVVTDTMSSPVGGTIIIDAEPKQEVGDSGSAELGAPIFVEETGNPIASANNAGNAPNDVSPILKEPTQFPVENAMDDAMLVDQLNAFIRVEWLSDVFGDNADAQITNTGGNDCIADANAQLATGQDPSPVVRNQQQIGPAGGAFDPDALLATALSELESAAVEFSRDLNINAPPQAPVEESMVPNFDSEEEDREATAEFEKVKDLYEHNRRTFGTTQAEDIDFRRRVIREKQRRDRYLQQREIAATASRERESPLFFSENARVSLSPEAEPFDFNESLEAALETPPVKNVKKGGRGRKRNDIESKKVSQGRVSKSGYLEKTKSGRGRPKGSQSKPKIIPQYTNLLFNNNTIADAQANAGKADQPTFSSTKKRQALEELIASMPEDQRALHITERKELDNATRKFHGKGAMKAIPESSNNPGGWRLKGMKSALRHYQLLGVGFMRDRENSNTRPFGGFMADEMGLGKTVMAIANIVDGKAAPHTSRALSGATLIVCPSTLISQWFGEIGVHAEMSYLGQVMVYRSGSKVQSNDPVALLSGMAVVVTSYSEVMRSWPKYLPPVECTNEAMKQAWYQNFCDQAKGPLHRVKFQRIILDEAQAIKNKDSQTSKAVCELLGKYRWAISGTPIQNSLEEFYPFFKFLKLPHSDTWEQFQQNFCRRGSQVGVARLKSYLQKYMFRRTHQDQLFGRPILKLPNVSSVTIEVHFNHVEKQIYRIVKTRFVNRIKAYVRENKADKAYQSIFVLLLRLRQIVCHALLIQKTLKDLLELADLEQLWALTDNEGSIARTDGSRETLRGLRTALAAAEIDRSNGSQASASESGPSNAHHASNGAQGTELAFKFRKYLEAMRKVGKWEEICRRSLCLACAEPPRQPYITSCMHCYCFACLNDMKYAAAIQNEDGARCIECGIIFEAAQPCGAFNDMVANDRGTPQPAAGAKKPRSLSDKEEDLDWFNLKGPMLQSAKTKATVLQGEFPPKRTRGVDVTPFADFTAYLWAAQTWLNQDPDAKILIFTQWRGMITCLSQICEEQGWGHAVFHGEMAFEARDRAIRRFSDTPDCKILLCAMKAGGVGLNLTAASRVIIIDLWWNQYVETQAFCRVFRIGQTKDVEMVRLVVSESVDMDILKMQARKNKEINNVMENRYRPEKLDTSTLLSLFGASEQERDGGEFVFSANVVDGGDDDYD